MPFFKIDKDPYPESTSSADNLAKRFQSDLLEAVANVLQRWADNDLQPGSKDVEMPGTFANGEMRNEVLSEFKDTDSLGLDPVSITRCWIAVRKAGYRELRDGRFELFTAKVKAAVDRRSR